MPADTTPVQVSFILTLSAGRDGVGFRAMLLSLGSRRSALGHCLRVNSWVIWVFCCVLLAAGLTGCGSGDRAQLNPDLARFAAAKRAQARQLAAAQTNAVPAEFWKLFDDLERDDWQRATSDLHFAATGRTAESLGVLAK